MNPKLERLTWAFLIGVTILTLRIEESFLLRYVEAATITVALFNLTNVKEKQ